MKYTHPLTKRDQLILAIYRDHAWLANHTGACSHTSRTLCAFCAEATARELSKIDTEVQCHTTESIATIVAVQAFLSFYPHTQEKGD